MKIKFFSQFFNLNLISRKSFCLVGDKATKYKINTREVNLNSSWVDSSNEKINKVLICLHGLFGNSNNWRKICYSSLIRDKRRSLLVDLRNHGDSDHHDSMNYNDMAEDVIRHANSLGINKFTLLGHSMGGKVAMQISEKFADRLDGLVIVDSAPKDHRDNINIYGNTKHVVDTVSNMNIQGKTRKEVLNELNKMFNGSVANLVNTNLSYVSPDSDQVEWRSNIKAIKSNYDKLIGFDIVRVQSVFEKPVIVVVGEKSFIFPIDVFKKLYPRINEGDVAVIKGAGHWVHSDKPNEVTECIAKFLDKIDQVK